MTAVRDGEASWRAPALDVRGPGTRGGHGRWRDAGPDDVFATGDRGELWVEGEALYFSGRREAWSVPLSWLGTPEAGLAGTLEIPVRTAGRQRSLSLRLEDAADGQPLAEAISRSRLQEPDPRDRRALLDLLALLQPELQRLEAAAATLAPADSETQHRHAMALLAAAARLRSTWLPYWGDPATRLRDAAIGALIGAGEATRSDAGAAALERYDQAVRRFSNVCEDLHDWCGLPESLDALPAPRWLETPPPEPAAAGPRSEMSLVSAESSSAGEAVSEPDPGPAARSLAATPAAYAAAPAATSVPSQTAQLSQPALTALDEQVTTIAPTRGQYQASPGAPPAGLAPLTASPGNVAERDQQTEDDSTLIVNSPLPSETPESLPVVTGVGGSDTLTQTPVVTGPGRPGSGGMTMLYRRPGFGPGGYVARKELQAAAVEAQDAANIFLRIGQRFAAVQHPNFVRIIETSGETSGGEAGGMCHFDMEFVEGEGIHARLRRGPLPLDQALDVIDQIAGAVDAVHQAGLVHGDVRPMNVLLEPGGRAVLLEPSVASDYTLEQRRGTIFGELSYLTPERVRGEPGDARGDIYAFGSLAYALLTGRPPFDGAAADIFAGHAEGTPAPLDTVVTAPAAAAAAIARSLSKRPSDRQPTAAELAAALRRAFTADPLQAVPAPTATGATSQADDAARSQPAEPPARPVIDPAAVNPAPPLPSRSAPSPLGGGAPGPLGGGAPGPLGRFTPPPPGNRPDDDLDETIIVRR